MMRGVYGVIDINPHLAAHRHRPSPPGLRPGSGRYGAGSAWFRTMSFFEAIPFEIRKLEAPLLSLLDCPNNESDVQRLSDRDMEMLGHPDKLCSMVNFLSL
jgi:hypothetical protein